MAAAVNKSFDLGQIISLLGHEPIHSIADEAFFSFLFWFEKKNLSLVSSSSKNCVVDVQTGRTVEYPKK